MIWGVFFLYKELWTVTKPFVPVVKDGRLYGRGSGDMKAGVVAFYQAFKALASLGWAPAADLQMQTVIEEECTGNGALSSSEGVVGTYLSIDIWD